VREGEPLSDLTGCPAGPPGGKQTGRGTDAHTPEESRPSTDEGHAPRPSVAVVRTESCACRVAQRWMSARATTRASRGGEPGTLGGLGGLVAM